MLGEKFFCKKVLTKRIICAIVKLTLQGARKHQKMEGTMKDKDIKKMDWMDLVSLRERVDQEILVREKQLRDKWQKGDVVLVTSGEFAGMTGRVHWRNARTANLLWDDGRVSRPIPWAYLSKPMEKNPKPKKKPAVAAVEAE